MSVPPIIYKQFRKYKSLHEMEGFQWFALTPAYGASYGDITRSYKFKKTPKLLDIGDSDIRVMIEDEIRKKDPNLVEYCDPDEQYSGTKANTKCHKLIKDIFEDEYDGTIINEKQLKGNDKYSIEDLEGPTEIVIWKDYSDLLEEELSEDNVGGKLTKRKTNKRKTNKRKTNKRKTNKRKKNEGKTNKGGTNKRRTNK